jgi:hypothetical protein
MLHMDIKVLEVEKYVTKLEKEGYNMTMLQ